MTPDEIKKAVNEVLDQRRGEDITHKEHHAFVLMMIEREERKKEMWQKIKTQVLGWGIIALIGTLGAWMATHLNIDIGGIK